MKSEYVAPSLEVVGGFEDLTKGTDSGNLTDAAFPPGTPFDELTFS